MNLIKNQIYEIIYISGQDTCFVLLIYKMMKISLGHKNPKITLKIYTSKSIRGTVFDNLAS